MRHVSNQFHIDIQRLQGGGLSANAPPSAGAHRYIIHKDEGLTGLDDVKCLDDVLQFAAYAYFQGNAVETFFLPCGEDLGTHHLGIF